MNFFTDAIIFYVLIVAFFRYEAFRYFRSVPNRRASLTLFEIDKIPAGLRSDLAAEGARLEALGFIYSHALLRKESLARTGPEIDQHLLVYQHQDLRAYAVVCPPTLMHDRPFTKFCTYFEDGFGVVTTNGTDCIRQVEIPERVYFDHYEPDLSKQLELHLKNANHLGQNHGSAALLTPEKQREAEQQEADRNIDELYARNLMTEDEEGTGFLNIRAALRASARYMKSRSRLAKLRLGILKIKQAQGAPPVSIEGEVKRFKDSRTILRSGRSTNSTQFFTFLVSILLFLLISDQRLSWHDLVLLTAVILLHELGHILGMFIFRYKDLKILFVPMLGALASGTRDKAPVYQRVIILLLGPMPGIILGAALLLLDLGYNHQSYLSAAIMLLTVNGFNLLPIMPLDGGQIMNLLVFSRYPILEGAYIALGAFALLAFGAFANSSLLCILGALLLLGVRDGIRRRRLLIAIRKSINERTSTHEPDEDLVLTEIYQSFGEKPFSEQGFPRRFLRARMLLDQIPISNAGFLQSTALFGIYLASLISFPVGLIGSISYKVSHYSNEVERICLSGDRDAIEDIRERIQIAANQSIVPLNLSLNAVTTLAECYENRNDPLNAIMMYDNARVLVLRRKGRKDPLVKVYSNIILNIYKESRLAPEMPEEDSER
jgi:Zn-dependent protease